MPTLEEQIKKDASEYQNIIDSKIKLFDEAMPQVPVTSDNGRIYMESYRKKNPGSTFVLKLDRTVIAYLYLKMYNETSGGIAGMTGDLAVGFANYDPTNLPTPADPTRSDPNWDPARANKNSIMLGFWDPNNASGRGKGILPFTATVNRGTGSVVVELYDDWSQEWP